ncbi:MAG TPA: S-adenosylmethionine:tRNA ribosyltransferase-isomerase [Candidatus Baltobacteraceae bacterium]|jgi:S-adenosylmethionine:tRNA ribosyltransferase-isomerase|nr:S-adenosylmethionine:tRNA ribosyltransferase-isomerase [Candidatus Baltobacteraceae bacterium]
MNAAAITGPLTLPSASAPAERRGIERDGVRLLVTNRARSTHTHAHFYDFAEFLREGDLLVVNDSATLPAALRARRSDGTELNLHVATAIDRRLWIAEPRGAATPGEVLQLPGSGRATVLAPLDPQAPRLWFTLFDLPAAMYAYLMEHGAPIRYGYVTEVFPLSDYQTIFAREPGSAEMPSAARPFTPGVLRTLRRHGVGIATITLHCGVSSFEAPERPTIERYSVPPETAELVNRVRRAGGRVVAAGTTVLRALESSVHDGISVASQGWTDLIIDERYRLQTADALLTGFHHSAATHQWILRAFADTTALEGAYREAAAAGYYQHEFGDVHLIV